ncbi:hypothetical protein ACOSP7_019061 [Xanthoceras sorbifolium]
MTCAYPLVDGGEGVDGSGSSLCVNGVLGDKVSSLVADYGDHDVVRQVVSFGNAIVGSGPFDKAVSGSISRSSPHGLLCNEKNDLNYDGDLRGSGKREGATVIKGKHEGFFHGALHGKE